MKPLKIILFLCLSLMYVPQASAQLALPPPLLVIIYGDELTSGNYLRPEYALHTKLEKKLRTIGFQVKVETMGKPKLTSREALRNIDSVIGKAPDVVILQLGNTDIERGFNAVNFHENMKRIINRIKRKGIYVMLMGTRVPSYRSKEYIKDFNTYFHRLGKKTPLYPYTLEGVVGNERLTLGDGYRPNSHGIDVIVNGIYHMVDAGLRWRLEQINKWRKEQQRKMYLNRMLK